MSSLDIILNETYKIMCGVDSLLSDSNNNILFKGNLTITSNLLMLGNTHLINSTLIKAINISGNSILKNNTTILSNLNVSSDTIIENNLKCNNNNILNNTLIQNNLLVSNFSILTGSVTMTNNLNINKFYNNNIINNNINSINNFININGSTINFGNYYSIVDIIGTSTFIATNQIKIEKKLLSINYNCTDIGNNAGLQFLGTTNSLITNNMGFILTTNDALNYLIKNPINNNINYVQNIDLNNNLIISGFSLFNNNVTILSQFNVSGTTIINNNITLLSKLNVFSNSFIKSSGNINNNLLVSSFTNINGNININRNLNNNNTLIIGNTTLLNNLNVNNFTNINGSVTLLNKLNVLKSINLQSLTNNNSLNISDFSYLSGNVTINNNLNILGQNIFQNININKNIFISNNTFIENSITLNNSLYISGKTIIKSNVTLNSNLNIKGSINNFLYHFKDNNTAKNAGIPIWGLYRNGGIVHVRLNDIPPLIYLSGPSYLTITSCTVFNDPGVYAIDYGDGNIPVYINGLYSGPTNLITTPIIINNTSTLVPLTYTLPEGNYTTTYIATDSNGLNSLNYRIYQIIQGTKKLVQLLQSPTYDSDFGNIFAIGNNWNGTTSVNYNNSGLLTSFYVRWGFTPTYLNSINLNYNNFSIIFKGTLVTYSHDHNLIISFNSNWDGTINNTPSINNGIMASKSLSNNSNTYLFNNNICSFNLNNSYYFIISVFSSYLNICVYNSSGSLILTTSTNNPYVYVPSSTPPYNNLFDIYCEDTWQWYSNVLVNTDGNLNLQDYFYAYET